VICATHTHSSYGGIYNIPEFQLMLGKFSSVYQDFIVDKMVMAVQSSINDENPSTVYAAKTDIPGLTTNRSIHLGPMDNAFVMIRFDRGEDKIELYNYSGHPVVTAEYDDTLISADYPGYFMDGIEEERPETKTISLIGSLGGTSVLFPEYKLPLDIHLHIINSFLKTGLKVCYNNVYPVELNEIIYEKLEIPYQRKTQKLFSPNQRIGPKDVIFYAVNSFVKMKMNKINRQDCFPLIFIKLGHITLTGFPLDTGNSIILHAREKHRNTDYPMFASQCNDYFGYLHTSDFYDEPFSRNKDQKTNAIYEKIMTFLDIDFGDKLLQEYERILKKYA